MIVICDLDGVIVDVVPGVKKYKLHDEEPDWEGFKLESSQFPPIKEVLELVNMLLHEADLVVFASGRPLSWKEETRNWLFKNLELTKDTTVHLWLRTREDLDTGKPASEFKLEVVRKFQAEYPDQPILILEDEPNTVELLTSEGFRVLQVCGTRYSASDAIPPSK